MIKSWIKNIIREYMEDRTVSQAHSPQPRVLDTPTIVAHSIRNGYVLQIQTNNHMHIGSVWGDYVYCKDSDELSAAIIAEFTKTKLGIPSHVNIANQQAAKQAVLTGSAYGSTTTTP